MKQPPQPPLTAQEERLLASLRETRGDPFALQAGQELLWDFDFPPHFLHHLRYRAKHVHFVEMTIKEAKHRVWRYGQPKQIRFYCKGRWRKAP